MVVRGEDVKINTSFPSSAVEPLTSQATLARSEKRRFPKRYYKLGSVDIFPGIPAFAGMTVGALDCRIWKCQHALAQAPIPDRLSPAGGGTARNRGPRANFRAWKLAGIRHQVNVPKLTPSVSEMTDSGHEKHQTRVAEFPRNRARVFVFSPFGLVRRLTGPPSLRKGPKTELCI